MRRQTNLRMLACCFAFSLCCKRMRVWVPNSGEQSLTLTMGQVYQLGGEGVIKGVAKGFGAPGGGLEGAWWLGLWSHLLTLWVAPLSWVRNPLFALPLSKNSSSRSKNSSSSSSSSKNAIAAVASAKNIIISKKKSSSGISKNSDNSKNISSSQK